MNFQTHSTIFLRMRLVREIKNVASFIKTRFYWRRCCIKMRKYAETFHVNKCYKLAIVVFIPTPPFSKQKFLVHFSNVICAKMSPCTPLCFIWKWISSTLFLIWHEINDNVFSPWGPVFRDFVRKKKKNLDVLRIFDNPLSKYLTTQFSLLRRLNFGQLLKLNRGLGLVTGAYFQNIFIWTCPLDNTSSIDRVWFFFTTIMDVF